MVTFLGRGAVVEGQLEADLAWEEGRTGLGYLVLTPGPGLTSIT